MDFNKIMPWAGIQSVIIDGQHMVKIPKFYIRVTPPAPTMTITESSRSLM